MLNGRVLDRVACWVKVIPSDNICGSFSSLFWIEGESIEIIIDCGKDGHVHPSPYDGLGITLMQLGACTT
jgi:hypothetical protein